MITCRARLVLRRMLLPEPRAPLQRRPLLARGLWARPQNQLRAAIPAACCVIACLAGNCPNLASHPDATAPSASPPPACLPCPDLPCAAALPRQLAGVVAATEEGNVKERGEAPETSGHAKEGWTRWK